MCLLNSPLDMWFAGLLDRSRRMAMKEMRCASTAVDDVVSDVMLKVTSLISHGTKTRHDIQRMLSTLVKNSVKDAYRRRRIRECRVDVHELPLAAPTPPFELPFMELTAGLEDEEVSLISGSYMYGKTDEEIAKEWGCSRSTVTRRRHDTVQKMKKLRGA